MRKRVRWGMAWRAALLALLAGAGQAWATDTVTVRVEEGQSLRDIAQAQLGDPDLWVELMRANGLSSVTEVRPGLELKIPVGQISAANQALAAALDAIQVATREGARVFAPDAINEAIQLREAGLARRREARWEESAALAGAAALAAGEALTQSLSQRDAAAEALLSDRHGWVEGQRPADVVWSERPLNAVLIEEEKVRTLSRSTAQITFRDESRLRLNANSQAVIQRMRVDPLSRAEEAKVGLIDGDFYALLAGRSERRNFELEIPEVETNIASTNFWVRRDATGSKFTNYDDRVLEVAAQGQSLVLGRNEGAVIRSGAAPSDKVEVLASTQLLTPPDDAIAFNAAIEVGWTPIANAAGYWLEVGLDPGFRRMSVSRWGLPETTTEVAGLEVGTYYWRVVGLDNFGLPGERSEVWRFHVRIDTTPPFLTLREPAADAILRTSPVEITGETEPDAVLRLDGRPVEVAPDGSFRARLEPRPGLNEARLVATDPAGNVTERARSFVYTPDHQALLVFDETIPRTAPRQFVTAREVISLAGRTEPDAQLAIRTAAGAARAAAYADPAGHFAVNVPLRDGEESFEVEIVTRSGVRAAESFTVTIDREPPTIVFESPPPAVTAVEWLVLRGIAAGAAELLLDNRPVRLLEDSFEETVTLREGRNRIVLVATDLVGNVRVENLEVELDQTPPELVRRRLSREQVAGGEPLTVEVVARDPSGLKQAAPFTLRVGSHIYADFLRFDPQRQSYSATVIMPSEVSGRVQLRDIELEDYAGNRRRYTFD